MPDNRLEQIVEHVSEGVVAVDMEGNLIAWNRTAREIIGGGPTDVPPQKWPKYYGLYCPEEQRPLRLEEFPLYRALQGQTIERQLLYRSKVDNGWRWLEGKACPLLDAEGNQTGAITLFRDITGQRLAAMNEALMTWVLNSTEDAIISVNADGVVMTWNPGAVRIFGYSAEEAIGMPVMGIVPPWRVAEIAVIRQRLRDNLPIPPMETVGWHSSGRPVEIFRTVTALRDPEGHFIGAITIARDISRRKQDERDLRRLQARLHSVQEEEFRRLSRELHDQLGQMLAAVKLDLTWLEAKLSQTRPELIPQITAVVGYVDETISSVRRIAAQMRPQLLEDLGLKAALGQLIEQFQSRGAFRARLHAYGRLELHPDCSLTLFRICQEALTNVIRHSQADEVEVKLAEVGEELVLEVLDNGRGVKPERVKDRNSLGLLGIRERALFWGGSVVLENREEGGARLCVRLPLARARLPLS